MKNIRQKRMFDKTKSILTQSIGVEEDKCFLIKGRRWVVACLTKRSRLRLANLWCKSDAGRIKHIAGMTYNAGYRLSKAFYERAPS